MTANHPTQPDLLAHLDGELPAARSREIREHLDYCQSCAAIARDLMSLSTDLKELPNPTADLAPTIMARVEQESEATAMHTATFTITPSANRPRRWWLIPATAAAVLLVGVILWNRPTTHSKDMRLAQSEHTVQGSLADKSMTNDILREIQPGELSYLKAMMAAEATGTAATNVVSATTTSEQFRAASQVASSTGFPAGAILNPVGCFHQAYTGYTRIGDVMEAQITDLIEGSTRKLREGDTFFGDEHDMTRAVIDLITADELHFVQNGKRWILQRSDDQDLVQAMKRHIVYVEHFPEDNAGLILLRHNSIVKMPSQDDNAWTIEGQRFPVPATDTIALELGSRRLYRMDNLDYVPKNETSFTVWSDMTAISWGSAFEVRAEPIMVGPPYVKSHRVGPGDRMGAFTLTELTPETATVVYGGAEMLLKRGIPYGLDEVTPEENLRDFVLSMLDNGNTKVSKNDWAFMILDVPEDSGINLNMNQPTRTDVTAEVSKNMRMLETALEAYFIDNNAFPHPVNEEGQVLPPGNPGQIMEGFAPNALTTPVAYLPRFLVDPFNPRAAGSSLDSANADPSLRYRYILIPQKAWFLYSYGPDGDRDTDFLEFMHHWDVQHARRRTFNSLSGEDGDIIRSRRIEE